MRLLPGIQSHIEGWTDPAELQFVAVHGYQLARIAAMECSDAVLLECVRDVEAVGMRPFITIADPERMRLFPGRDWECRNEDDGDISPAAYRRILDDMAKVAVDTGSRLWGPTCSNTNRKCVRWAKSVRGSGWPVGMHGLSWHSYDPHENTEFAAVEALADGRPIIYSEFGYPSLGITDEEQAAKKRALWQFYEQRGAYGAIWFQIHDGPNPNEREHRYGIRACAPDGTLLDWKPSAYTIVPDTHQEITMLQVHEALSRTDAIPDPSRSGRFVSPHPDNDGSVLSVQPNGSLEKRPAGTFGAYETWYDDGRTAVFDEVVSGRKFAILLVD